MSSMKKRQRAYASLLNTTEELGVSSPVYTLSSESDSDTCLHCTNRPTSAFYTPSESLNTAESLGTTEMDLLHLKDEELSEMALFLSASLRRISSLEALSQLVEYFYKKDWKEVCRSMKYVGVLGEFFENLCLARLPSANVKSLLLFIKLVKTECSADVLSNPEIIRFMIFVITPQTSTSGDVSSPPPKRHWSCRKTKAMKSEGSHSTTKMERLLTEMGCEGSKSCSAIAIDTLFELVFSQNQLSLAVPDPVNVCIVLVECGGLLALSQCIQQHVAERREVFLLIEVLTLSGKLHEQSKGYKDLIVSATECFLKMSVTDADYDPVLRTITNLTNITPSLFSPFSIRLAEVLRRNVTTSDDDEVVTFSLCCAINLCRKDVATSEYSFVRAFCSGGLIDRVTQVMCENYQTGKVELLVMSGYCALLLGTISLCVKNEEWNLRIDVITAVVNATKSSPIKVSIEDKPMKLIVAILQEFLLFQSSSSTLTKGGLLEVSSLITEIIERNEITIE